MNKAIVIGAHTVTVVITRKANHSVYVLATCGSSKKDGIVSVQGSPEHVTTQTATDVDKFVMRIASEAAGAEQSRLNLDRVFGETVECIQGSPKDSSASIGPGPNSAS